MRKLFILLNIVLYSTLLSAQDLQKFHAEIESLKARVTMLEQKLAGSVDTAFTVKANSTESKCFFILFIISTNPLIYLKAIS